MKFGLFLNNQSTPSGGLSRRIAESLEQTRAARDAGFDLVCAGEHYLGYPYEMPSQFPLLARVAAEAGKMHVASNITLIALHNPVAVADAVATLDAICEGRFIFGAGLGYREHEFAAFGVDPKRVVARFLEALHVIQLLWTPGEIQFKGEFFEVPKTTPCTFPVQKPHPPIWIAANNDAGVQRAARRGFVWSINPHATIPIIERQMTLYRSARQQAGHAPATDVPLMREMYIAPTREQALKESMPYIARKYKVYEAWGQDKALTKDDTFNLPPEELLKDRFLIGDPDYVIQRLEEYERRLGITYAIFRMQWPDMPHRLAMAEIELMAKHVIPHFKKGKTKE